MVEGRRQAAFDHAKIHRELNTGKGAESLSKAAGTLSKEFADRLQNVDDLVRGAIGRCRRSWRGKAAEAMEQEASPFRDVVQQSRELSAALARRVESQADHFSRTKHSMPGPHDVPPLDLGLSDLVPTNLSAKLAGQQVHEAKHNDAEQRAREIYAAYRTSSDGTVRSLKPYPAVPAPVADVGVASTQRPDAVDPSTGYLGTSSSAAPTSRTADPETTASGFALRTDQGGPGESGTSDSPAGADSASAAPTAPGAGTASPPGTGGSPGVGGVVGYVPATSGTPGRASGSGPGLGSRGGSGTRGGPGGGRTGAGPATNTPASGSSTARGGSGAFGGLAAPGPQDRRGEDEEHERKYVKSTDEHFEFDPDVDPDTGQVIAPPVIGGSRRSEREDRETD
ncbi:PPE domain-containing protein [Saccharopolyspora soli]|uniref:PPE domain-containing protein n=1 Tax=Saccharopolyspora soli TaxID=2926618 RepID=UPI00241396CA|nr:PPE domain-containing protein [Saccharopolyspora soli]